MTPHAVPSQHRSYAAAFGHPPLRYTDVDPNRPDHVRQWDHWARWKLGFMDAAWKDAQFGVSRVSPRLLSVTQSQYGFSAFTDGYYFNVVRSLPVISGHGGYHDYNLSYFNPSYFLEVARARDFGKPNWYLPTWYGNTTSDQFRLEQYLSFQTGHPGHDHAARLRAGRQSRPAAGDRRVEPADEEARPDLPHHAGHQAAGGHAVLAVELAAQADAATARPTTCTTRSRARTCRSPTWPAS